VSVDDATVDGAAVKIRSPGPPRSRRASSISRATAQPANGPNDVAFELAVRDQRAGGRSASPARCGKPDAAIGAAAPLLRAVRDSRTRDAVRSAIERLTAQPARPAGGGAAAAE